MTYITEDQAVESAEPVEMYHFVGPAGFEYFYTPSRASQSYSGDTYTPLTMDRSDVVVADIVNPEDLTITVPYSCQMVQDYFPIPVRFLDVTIYRRHGASAFVLELWKGSVVEFSPKGLAVDLRAEPSSAIAMSQVIPRLRFQQPCAHDFGSTRCGINLALHTVSTTVSAISSDGLTLTMASVGTGTLKGGEVRRTADGESRMITGVSGSDVTIDLPFYTLSVSDAVDLVSGCDRNVQTCFNEYNNVANHGGFPFMPHSWNTEIPKKWSV